MANIVGVRFQNAGKLYYFDPNGLWPVPGDYVVVETNRGIFLGETVTAIHEIPDEKLTEPLKPVIRLATPDDMERDKADREAEKSAFDICRKKIAEHELDMKLVSCEYSLDQNKIIFYFSAKNRVDFRALVKDLAFTLHKRIELRQIGPRDEAKMLGGLGPCGRPVCCGVFLGECRQVALRMAKEQNLAMNPSKTSGLCGRLMCCLRFEQEVYEETRKRMPKVGRVIQTPDGEGAVSDLNIVRETVKVRISRGDSFDVKEFPLSVLAEMNHFQPEAAAETQSVTGASSAEEKIPSTEESTGSAAPKAEQKTKPAPRPAVRTSEPPREEPVRPQDLPERKQSVPAAPESSTAPAQPDRRTSWMEALERAKKAAQDQNQP